jgi:hypothetical protein
MPIVFAETADPVGAGVVESLARPGRNATWFTNFEYGYGGKWVQFLKEIAPGMTRIGVLRDPAILWHRPPVGSRRPQSNSICGGYNRSALAARRARACDGPPAAWRVWG